jgi:hypothetical protein
MMQKRCHLDADFYGDRYVSRHPYQKMLNVTLVGWELTIALIAGLLAIDFARRSLPFTSHYHGAKLLVRSEDGVC